MAGALAEHGSLLVGSGRGHPARPRIEPPGVEQVAFELTEPTAVGAVPTHLRLRWPLRGFGAATRMTGPLGVVVEMPWRPDGIESPCPAGLRSTEQGMMALIVDPVCGNISGTEFCQDAKPQALS